MSAHGVYVHVPWCRRRCPYCAFYVEPERTAGGAPVPWDAFVDAVLREARRRATTFPGPARTVFLGGGTPSRLPEPALRRLLDGLPRIPGAEVSVEANPEDLTPAWLDAAVDAGVNRVSVGVQTFNPAFARLLNRNASVREARQTVARVATAGLRSWSLDLIFALPGQTLADLDADLDAILAAEPPHVSLYGLTWEPGTPLTRARDAGRLGEVDDELWRAMYDRIVERLEAAGLRRYEVSNFARDGHASDHNRGYWTDRPYADLGPAAHGYAPDGARWVNVADVAAYLTAADPTATEELPTGLAAAADLVVAALRGVDGVPRDGLARRGVALDAGAVARLVRQGVLADHGHALALTPAGFPVADAVAGALLDALHDRRGSAEAPGPG